MTSFMMMVLDLQMKIKGEPVTRDPKNVHSVVPQEMNELLK